MAFLTQGSVQLGIDTFIEFVPRRFALKYNPPTIVMEYLIPSSGKLYIHSMKLKYDDLSTNPEEIYSKLLKKHRDYLDPQKVSEAQVIELIKLLQNQSSEEIIL